MSYLWCIKRYSHMSSCKLYLFLFTLALFLAACAQTASPSGGPRDTQAPELQHELSTPNGQVNFQERKITLSFDEWIQLDNVYGQLVVSPPLEYRPEIKARGKSLEFSFDTREVLLDSTTYTINFGKSIKDQTEGNKLSALSFVFSTGPVLDSLEFSGRVLDAFTSEPAGDKSVLLFSHNEDSAVVKVKPQYFAATDEGGQFHFKNLRSGHYRLIAIEDKNNNLKFDPGLEPIAFSSELISLPDTGAGGVLLMLSKPLAHVTPLKAVMKDSFSVVVGYASTPELPLRLHRESTDEHYMLIDEDSVRIWWKDSSAVPGKLILVQGDQYFDTLSLSGRIPGSYFLKMQWSSASTGPLAPNKPFEIRFNQPLLISDTAGVSILDSSGSALPVSLKTDSLDMRKLIISAPFKQAQLHELIIVPGALTGWNGKSLADTLRMNIPSGKLADFGTLLLQLEDISPEAIYWVELVRGDNDVVYSAPINGSGGSSQVIRLLNYPPGKYALRVISDLNANQKWDPGDYWNRQQPESVRLIPLEELRANWELKLNISLKARN